MAMRGFKGRCARLVAALLAGGLLGLAASAAGAAPFRLVVQPIQTPQFMSQAWQPLARYLTRQLGEPVQLVTAHNFLTYWETMKRPGSYDLVLDAAHFTAFRMQRMGYEPLVKLPEVVSFSLVTDQDTLILEADELVGKRIATLASPSLGALRLAELFANPIQQPQIIEVDSSDEAIAQLRSGRAVAAMIPTPLAVANPGLNTVLTTPQVPQMALSAGPSVAPETRARIRDALLNAERTPEGRQMLEALRLQRFEPADPALYRGLERLLEGVWGY
jgi:phosphonate transport system substrate-binding protein